MSDEVQEAFEAIKSNALKLTIFSFDEAAEDFIKGLPDDDFELCNACLKYGVATGRKALKAAAVEARETL